MLPVLLEAFPAPPSFVPRAGNPPPSAPPSSPLPALPRSRSGSTILNLNGSIRSSKLSLASSSSSSISTRDSVSSFLSSHKIPFPADDDHFDHLTPPSSPDVATLIHTTPRSRTVSTTDPGHDILQLKRDLDGSDSDDSSIDLHTPLPHLMLRHGLLSPNSKLLAPSMPSSPCPGDRPGSVTSMADSVRSGLIKDSRDTPRRRVRHRDGKLLKGGIGLTTGLGWSDSEDEDAPSALTKRISRLNLTKSTSSLRSSTSSGSRSLSHSQSHSSLSSYKRVKTPSLPPTSWSRRVQSTASTASSRDSLLSVTIPVVRSAHHDTTATTPSSASSLNFPAPTTPQDDPLSLNRDKLLPSLPNPKTGSIRRPYLRSASSTIPLPQHLHGQPSPLQSRRRSQTLSSSSSSSGSSPPDLPPIQTPATAPATSVRSPPRQLRLPSRSVSSDRLVLPQQPSLRYSQQRSTLRSVPSTPTFSTVNSTPAFTRTTSNAPAGIPVPRIQPRTGTGMVYRSTAAPKPPPSPIRQSTIGIAL